MIILYIYNIKYIWKLFFLMFNFEFIRGKKNILYNKFKKK